MWRACANRRERSAKGQTIYTQTPDTRTVPGRGQGHGAPLFLSLPARGAFAQRARCPFTVPEKLESARVASGEPARSVPVAGHFSSGP